MKILVAVDGSKSALKGVDCLIEHSDWHRDPPAVELVTVHLPVPKLPRMGMVVGKAQIAKYYEEEGESRLAAARKERQRRYLLGAGNESLAATYFGDAMSDGSEPFAMLHRF